MGAGGEKKIKTEILRWGMAAGILGLILIAAFLFAGPNQDETPEIVLLGDSIYALGRGEDAVTDRLSRELHKRICNAAMGGTGLSRMDQERWMDHTTDSMSMVSLSKAILSKDFSVQRQARIRVPATEYFGEVIEELNRIDFDSVQILLVGYGMNDYQNGVPLENPENAMDEYSFSGALRRVLQDFRREYPTLRVILLTPTYSWYLSTGKSCEEQDWGGGYLEQYVECEKKIAGEFDTEIIDLYHDLFPREGFADWEKNTVDGVHPNEAGRELLAERIAEYLEEHP